MTLNGRNPNLITGVIFLLTGALTAFGASSDLTSAAVWVALGVACCVPTTSRTTRSS